MITKPLSFGEICVGLLRDENVKNGDVSWERIAKIIDAEFAMQSSVVNAKNLSQEIADDYNASLLARGKEKFDVDTSSATAPVVTRPLLRKGETLTDSMGANKDCERHE